MQSVEKAECQKCKVWKMCRVGNAGCGKCRVSSLSLPCFPHSLFSLPHFPHCSFSTLCIFHFLIFHTLHFPLPHFPHSLFSLPHFPHYLFSTLLIFHTSHFPHSLFSTRPIFNTSHFPHSSFSTLPIFNTSHFPHSTFSTPHIFLAPHYPAMHFPYSIEPYLIVAIICLRSVLQEANSSSQSHTHPNTWLASSQQLKFSLYTDIVTSLKYREKSPTFVIVEERVKSR